MLLAVGWIWSLYCDYNVLDGESSWRHVVLTCGKVSGTFSKLAVGFSLTYMGSLKRDLTHVFSRVLFFVVVDILEV